MHEPSEEARRLAEQAEYEKAVYEGVIPPARMWTMVGAATDFYDHGRGLFSYLVKNGRISNRSAVLDVGCGLGKTAIHFATYLQSPGCYEGLDVEKPSIDWCVRAITSRFPLIRFRHIDLHSDLYNPSSGSSAAQFSFPYDSARFDLVFLASVFTHMFDAEVANYLREIARVLKPGGICISTYYLLNDEKRAGIAAGTAQFTFAHPHLGSRVEYLTPPEGAVAHEESRIRTMMGDAGLEIIEPPQYGIWATQKVQSQDFLIAQKA